MSVDWPLVKIEDVCSLIVDRVNKTAPVSSQSTPFRMIRTTNVRNGRIDLSDCKRVDEETFKKWTRRANLKAGDVVLTREAPIGEVGRMPEQDGVFLGQRLMQYRADPDLLDDRFLLYSFLSPQLQHQFGSHEGSGSVVSHIRVGDCVKFELRLPPLAEQRKIGEILGAIDDKIDLNRRLNQTLEAMAQALFKSWFVDFDPVKAKIAAKEEGRDPLRAAMSAISGKIEAELDALPTEQFDELAVTAALFPDGMGELEFAALPSGWKLSTLKEFCAASSGWIQTGPFGSQLHASDYTEEGIPVVMPLNLQNRRVSEFRIARILQSDADRLSKHQLRLGDIVFSRRGDVTKHATVSARETGWLCGTGCLLIRPSIAARTNAFLSQALITPESIVWLQRHAVGATMPNLNTGILGSMPVIGTPVNVLESFEAIVGPIENKIAINFAQSNNLSNLRDSLLPKLLSGELSVADIASTLDELPA